MVILHDMKYVYIARFVNTSVSLPQRGPRSTDRTSHNDHFALGFYTGDFAPQNLDIDLYAECAEESMNHMFTTYITGDAFSRR